MFSEVLIGSITDDLDDDTIERISADLVVSSATIEHVGNEDNQQKMIVNIIKKG
jgi:hypothetical protein